MPSNAHIGTSRRTRVPGRRPAQHAHPPTNPLCAEQDGPAVDRPAQYLHANYSSTGRLNHLKQCCAEPVSSQQLSLGAASTPHCAKLELDGETAYVNGSNCLWKGIPTIDTWKEERIVLCSTLLQADDMQASQRR